MGEEGKLFGCIYGGLKSNKYKKASFQHNYDVINNLPDTVDLPNDIYFTKHTFTVPIVTINPPNYGNYRGFYRTQTIHFAQSFKYLDDYLDGWIESFESLLRNLFWWETYLFVEQEANWNKT